MKTVAGPTDRVVVVGAGLSGLAAALYLTGDGRTVTLLERADHPGGRVGRYRGLDYEIDSGATVLTLPGPCPNLDAAPLDWDELGPAYLRELLNILAERGYHGIAEHFTVDHLDTPGTWREQGMLSGTPFSAAHLFRQPAHFVRVISPAAATTWLSPVAAPLRVSACRPRCYREDWRQTELSAPRRPLGMNPHAPAG